MGKEALRNLETTCIDIQVYILLYFEIYNIS